MQYIQTIEQTKSVVIKTQPTLLPEIYDYISHYLRLLNLRATSIIRTMEEGEVVVSPSRYFVGKVHGIVSETCLVPVRDVVFRNPFFNGTLQWSSSDRVNPYTQVEELIWQHKLAEWRQTYWIW